MKSTASSSTFASNLRNPLLGFATIGLLIVSATSFLTFSSSVDYNDGGSSSRQVSYTLLLLVSIGASGAFMRPRLLFCIPWPITLVLLYALASISWSAYPDISFRRLLLTTFVIVTLCVLIKAQGPDRFMNMLRIGLILLLAANWLSVLIVPAAVHQAREVGDLDLIGAWRGVLPHKNAAGSLCVITILCFLFTGKSYSWPARAGIIAAAAIFLYRTHSKTSIILAIVAIAAGGLMVLYDRRWRGVVAPLVLSCVVGFVAAGLIYIGPYLDKLNGSTDAFTGRIVIWRSLIAYIRDHPSYGAGFGAFWNVGSEGPVYQYARSWVIQGVGQGHSGYLDIASQLGIPGLVTVVIAMFLVPIGRLVLTPQEPRGLGGFLLSVLIFTMLHNVTESSMMDRDTLLQVFLVMAGTLVHLTCRTGAVGPVHRKSSWLPRSAATPSQMQQRPA